MSILRLLGGVAEWSNAPVLPRDGARGAKRGRVPRGKRGHAKNRLGWQMYFVYVLHSSGRDRFYIGSTSEPDTRFKAHNAGRVRSTKAYCPWRMLLLEEHADRLAAEKRERYLKSGWGRRWLEKHLKEEGWQSGRMHRS